MALGINGKFLPFIQSLYMNVFCSVRINEFLTDISPVKQGVKQGCGLSPTLFAIYAHDLATEINALNYGIKYENNEISLFC